MVWWRAVVAGEAEGNLHLPFRGVGAVGKVRSVAVAAR